MVNNTVIKNNTNKIMVIKNFFLITIILSIIISFLIYFTITVVFQKQISQIQSIATVLFSRVNNIDPKHTDPTIINDTTTDFEFVNAEFDDYFSALYHSSDNKPSAIINYDKIKLTNYPSYGSKYGDISISSLDINLPLYFGDSLQILKNGGIGHNSGSYFPGEGASIIACGHNTAKVLKKIANIKVGDTAIITTTYGEFEYKVFKTKIIKETDLDELPIQKNLEILMIYTCYPFGSIGHVTERFVVYFERIR